MVCCALTQLQYQFLYETIEVPNDGFVSAVSRIGNFIIGASGSDKQVLCGSSRARTALTISVVNSIQKRYIYVCHSSYKSVFMAWNFKKKENVMQ